MVYEKHVWQAGEPITQERMRAIENGIADSADAINGHTTDISTLSGRVTNLNTDLGVVRTTANNAANTASSADTKADDGVRAWDQLKGVITVDSNTQEVTKNLASCFSEISNQATEAFNRGDTAYREVQEARGRKLYGDGNNAVAEKLKDKLDNMDYQIDQNSTRINTSLQNYDNAKGGYSSLQDRLNSIDGDTTNSRIFQSKSLASHVNDIENTLTEARTSAVNDATYGSIDARFEADEGLISNLGVNKINYTDIVDNLNQSDTNKPLSANQGRAIKAMIGGTYDSTNTVTAAINTAQSNAESNAQSYADTNKVDKTDIKKALTYDTDDNSVLQARQGKLLKDEIDAINSGLNTASTGLVARVSALETEVDMTSANSRIDLVSTEVTNARTSSVIRTPGAEEGDPDTDTTYGSLDARLEAIETLAATNKTAVDTSIDGLDARLDKIDGGSTLSGETTLASRVGTIESDLNTESTGLKAKVNTLESDLNTATTGIKDRLTAAENTANAAATASDLTTLTGRVATLEGKDTVVINTPQSGSNYTEGVPNATAVASPSENADYLIADDEGTYFYWRYFGAVNGWQLISSAGSGSGSSSGTILSELPTVSEGDPNIDYFIGSNVLGYTHYRFVEAGTGESEGHYIKILPAGTINDIEVTTVTLDNAAEADKWPSGNSFSGGLEAYSVDDTSKTTNILSDFVAVRNARIQAVYNENDELQSQKLQVIDTNGKLMEYPIVGGGTSTASLYNGRITSSTAANRSIPSTSTDPVSISAKVIIQQGNTSLGENAVADGIVQYRRRGTSTWNTGSRIEVTADTPENRYIIPNDTTFTVDITGYLVEDVTMEFRLALTAYPTSNEEDAFAVYSSTFRVTKVNISIADESFDYGSVKSSNFQFNYRCFGSGISKTVHFLLDDTDIVTPVVTSSHNTVLQQVIPMTGKSNGMHTFQVYFVTSTGLESNRLNYYILYNTDSSRQAPLIGAAAKNASITDGDELVVNYSVSTIGSETTDSVEIELYTMDNGTKNTIQTDVLTNVPNNVLADPPYSTFNYPRLKKEHAEDPDPDPITVYVKFTAYHGLLSDTQTVQVSINYLNTNYDLDPQGENNLLYSYVSYGRSNNQAGKETYEYTFTNVRGQEVDFTGTFSNFNWSTDGYVDGKCLTIGGGATLNINVPIFNNSVNGISLEENADAEGVLDQDITKNGRTIEIDYEVQSATDLNAVIMNCMTNIQTSTENGITTLRANGFQITPQSCYLLNSSTGIERDSSGFILNEDQIAAAYLTPGQRIHLVFVIEPWATDAARDAAFDGEYHQSTNIYVNGEFANTCPYNRDKNTGNLAGNNFSTNATITIGDDSCLIKLYSIKLYNRGLTQEQVLQNYKVAPIATRDKLVRLEENDILNASGFVDYEKARTKYTCLLLTGPAPTNQNNDVVPTISPFKGSPSPAGRRDKKTNEVVGKTESGLTLTKPSNTEASGYTVEFNLQDTIPEGQAAYLGAAGSYCSSNNVQGTSSQKYPVHNLKVYLAKWQPAVPAEYEEQEVEDPETHEVTTQQVEVKAAVSAGIAKVKYSLKGYGSDGKALGTEESTLCWKADYMSTDHANTFNANIADGLFNNRTEDGWPISDWDSKHYQNTVYGIRCLLFQKQGDNPPEFVGDGCLNNDKGNSKTYGLEDKNDSGNNTRSQKWEFTNNSEDLGYFKTDDLTASIGDNKIRAQNGFESCYPDEGDLKDDGLTPNYNHLQILLTWVAKRANYWDETDPTLKAQKKAIFKNEFTKHFNLNHVLTYYLFSQYVALCDNRVKNMFMRSDNIKEEIIRNTVGTPGTIILNGNNEPDALWSNYVDPSTGATTPSYIDWETGEGHSNFAIWEPVLYDLDSCFGVENVGLLKIRYDADWDYEWKGTPQFNGYNSVFWLMVEDSYQSELATLALSLYNQYPGLNFRTFNQQQIIENQAQISPALTNQDMILKFDKPWSEGFINYAETPDGSGNYPEQTPLYKYLQRGSRAAQKVQFMQQRSMLLSSLYGADEFKNSAITFRTGVPVGASGNIVGYANESHEIVTIQDAEHTIPVYGNGDLTETQITLKANQILYPGVAYGDNKPATRVLVNDGKVSTNTSCTIQATSAVQGNDGIFIYGASVLTDIGDISKFKPLQLNVSTGVNLKRLIIGSNATGYSNNTTNSITGLNKCVLLEEINVRNLKQMSTLTLTSNGFIKEVYAAGSGIGTISLPQGGVLETIEYSASTTDITIVNQGRLTSFTYEDSSNNNYANVTRLWIENTPNVPIKDIITARLTPIASQDAGLRAGGLRLVGINLNLVSDPSFLELITSDLVKGTYLTSNGGHTEGNNQTPYISGTITITSIRASLLAKLNEMYPDLVINANEVVNEFEIKYENYDGTLLFTDHGTNEDDLKDPVYDTNPITGTSYISMPTKPQDVQYKYKFGTYDGQNRYRKFSGWVRKGTTTNPTIGSKINGSITLVAVYPTTEDQYYTVSWYDGDTFLSSIEAKYGTDLTQTYSPIESGTLQRIKSIGNGIKVFSGWSRPLGKITGNINVYAQWQTSSISDTTESINLASLNAADLYALSITENATKKRLLQDQLGSVIYIPMGRDFNYTEGVTVTNLVTGGEPLTFDGSRQGAIVHNEITPLSTNSDWTLAIDYKFLFNSGKAYFFGTEYVLASCYKNANSSVVGFKLSMLPNASGTGKHQIQITWGNQSQIIDYASSDSTLDDKTFFNSHRNVVVLSHNSDEPNILRISYVPPYTENSNANNGINFGMNFGLAPTNTTLTWENNTLIDTPLILGGNYDGATTNIEEATAYRQPAQGIIYWAKFWNTNLGELNCTNLAAWPHETIPFYLTGYNGDNASNATAQIYSGTNLSFAAAQGVGDRYYWPYIPGTEYDDNRYFGWHQTKMRTICNSSMYMGFPEAYLSVINQTSVTSQIKHADQTDSNMSTTTQDYLFLPAMRELNPDASSTVGNQRTEVNVLWQSPWPWMVPSAKQNVLGLYSSTSYIFEKKTTVINPYLYRFLGAYVDDDHRMFLSSVDPSTINNLQYKPAGESPYAISVRTGDVWIQPVNSSTDIYGNAYMYFTNADIERGVHVDIATTNGGWKMANYWDLRSLNLGSSSSNENSFLYVTSTGALNLTPSGNTGRDIGRLLCPEFTI